MTHFDLRRLKLRSGDWHRDEVELELEPLEFGGQRYVAVPERVPGELVISRATTGTVFQLSFHARLHGPCVRCLDDAVVNASVSGREYQATSPGESDELRSEYVVDDGLDLTQWSRDLLAAALPEQILCEADCPGLCPVCGKNQKDEPHTHGEEEPDARWAALAELRDRL